MTLIGHPFDTLKVRMQASAQSIYSSTFHCARQTVAVEGWLALYKGLQPAMLTTCTTSGLRFGVQNKFNDYLVSIFGGAASSRAAPAQTSGALTRRQSNHVLAARTFDDLPASTRVLAEGGGGAACGLVLPLIFTPMEMIKVQRQVLRDNTTSNATIARNLWRQHGLAGLYTGHRLTVARSTLGNMTLFGSFEAWKALLRSARSALRGGGGADESPAWTTSVAAGVLSGWTTQLVVFPIDSAKSRMQAKVDAGVGRGGSGGGGGGAAGILPALAQLWREGTMYRGLSSMLLRAVPVHMAYLPVYGLFMTAVAA